MDEKKLLAGKLESKKDILKDGLKKENEFIKKEIEEQIQKEVNLEVIVDKDNKDKAEDIKDKKDSIEGSEQKKEEKDIGEVIGYSGKNNPAYLLLEEKKLDYDYLFRHVGTDVKTIGEEYDRMISTDTSIALLGGVGNKDIMDNEQLNDYIMKQATNFLLGTNMNNISYDEKIRFNAFMTDPSNRIIFLVNYAMLGLEHKIPMFNMSNNNSGNNSEIKTDYKITIQEIKEKSMKNDIAISSRFDMKTSSAKEYIGH